MHRKIRHVTWTIAAMLWVAPLSAERADVRLVTAVKQGDHAAVRALLKARVDVNTPEADGTTALHWAVQQAEGQTVDLLIGAGAKVNAANRYSATPLRLAAINGSAEMLQKLLSAGADPHAMSVGEPVLHTAARSGRAEAVRVLLAAGADVNAKEVLRGQTALMAAAAEKYDAVAEVLLEAGADVHARSIGSWTAILFAARAGADDVIRLLLAAGANVGDSLTRPGAEGSSPPARNSGMDETPDGLGTTVLMMAIVNGHYDLSAFLLEQGADPNADTAGRTALHALVQIRNWEYPASTPRVEEAGDYLALMKALLAHGANPNARLTKAWFTGQVNHAGVANPIGLIGATPFWWAARAADVAAMRLLLAHGADPFLATTENTTPLMVAAGVGHLDNQTPGSEPDAVEAVKLIVGLGADINAANNCQPKGKVNVGFTTRNNLGILCGWTPLHGAASRGRDSIVQFLVDQGAKLDATDIFGRTPLQLSQGHVVFFTMYQRESTARLLAKLMGSAQGGQTAQPR